MFTISNKTKGENINVHFVNQIQSILFLHQLIIKVSKPQAPDGSFIKRNPSLWVKQKTCHFLVAWISELFFSLPKSGQSFKLDGLKLKVDDRKGIYNRVKFNFSQNTNGILPSTWSNGRPLFDNGQFTLPQFQKFWVDRPETIYLP